MIHLSIYLLFHPSIYQSSYLSRSGEISLNDCLEAFTKEEVLDGDEMPVILYFFAGNVFTGNYGNSNAYFLRTEVILYLTRKQCDYVTLKI